MEKSNQQSTIASGRIVVVPPFRTYGSLLTSTGTGIVVDRSWVAAGEGILVLKVAYNKYYVSRRQFRNQFASVSLFG
eukprot:scaffold539933_cov24-Attheya_sp.AAC.1